jgi:hypothetical protein
MRNWMLRGLVFAAAMVVVRLVQGALINAWQTQAGLISVVLLLLFTIAVVVWGSRDGLADARATADPDRRQDLAMVWLLAGLVAGILSGAVSWLIALFYTGLYTGGLLNEVTTFAAFTALLVFVPGIIGVAVGRWRVDRQFAKEPEKHHGLGVKEERGDTDVFSAVRADDTPTGEVPTQPQAAARTRERTASVTTVERDAPTEAIPTAQSERTTESIPTTDDDAKTEVIRTDTTEPRHVKPRPEPDQR